MKGISAVIAAILMLMITMALAGVAYFYISGIFATKTLALEPVGEADVIKPYTNLENLTSCRITWNIRNTGTTSVTVSTSAVSEDCTDNLVASENIGSGSTKSFIAGNCSSGRSHTFKAIGPSNTVTLIGFCS